jgi:hypothetical protein
MIAECAPSATWWVEVIAMAVKRARPAPGRYSAKEGMPMQRTLAAAKTLVG